MTKLAANLIRLAPAALTLALLVLLAGDASACPTCKENLAADPAAANIVRGYFYSILFMLSMPPLILSGLSLYFYYEVRKARALQAKAAAAGHSAASDGVLEGLAQA